MKTSFSEAELTPRLRDLSGTAAESHAWFALLYQVGPRGGVLILQLPPRPGCRGPDGGIRPGRPKRHRAPDASEGDRRKDSHFLWGHGHARSDQVQGVGKRRGCGSSECPCEEAGPRGQGSERIEGARRHSETPRQTPRPEKGRPSLRSTGLSVGVGDGGQVGWLSGGHAGGVS